MSILNKKLELTPEQQEIVRELTGQTVEAIEIKTVQEALGKSAEELGFTVEELEERITPGLTMQ